MVHIADHYVIRELQHDLALGKWICVSADLAIYKAFEVETDDIHGVVTSIVSME